MIVGRGGVGFASASMPTCNRGAHEVGRMDLVLLFQEKKIKGSPKGPHIRIRERRPITPIPQ